MVMGGKIKGIYKGFKHISQMFVVKERELEIGYPTDVKHVAHIGWDGASGTAPTWMHEFKSSAELSSKYLGSFGERRETDSNAFSTLSSKDFEESARQHQPTELFKDSPSICVPGIPKRQAEKDQVFLIFKVLQLASSEADPASSQILNTGRKSRKTSLRQPWSSTCLW